MNTEVLFLVLFALSSGALGATVVGYLSRKLRGVTFAVSSVVLGFFVSAWLIYVLASITGSLDTALVVFAPIGLVSLIVIGKKRRLSIFVKPNWYEVLVLAGTGVVSIWIFFKSLHGGPNGTLLVGTNEVFDFGHALAVTRSFSQGSNVPYSSPFIAGEPHVYHFLFYFLSGILERLGIPIVYALNVPAVVSFSALLYLVSEMTIFLFKNIWSGALAVYLTLTHGTLMFWYFLTDPKNIRNPLERIWHNAAYYFAGPYDGATISIFWTLNVMVNQRHLVFGLSVALLLFYILLRLVDDGDEAQTEKFAVLGILTGLMVWWHTMLFGAVLFVLLSILLSRRMFREALFFVASSIGVAGMEIAPWMWVLSPAREAHGQLSVFSWFLSPGPYSFLAYWVMNLGVALITIPAGFMLLPKKKRTVFLPFFGLFILANFVRFGRDLTENHKFLNLVFLVGNMLSAGYIVSLLGKRNMPASVIASILVFLLSFSGIIDLMVIKNDFQYPVDDYRSSPFMRWVKSTDPSSVFLSYQDIFDPVSLSGRKTYFGFFGARMYPARGEVARQIFEATTPAGLTKLKEADINYLVIPKWKKDDFNYSVNPVYLRQNLTVSYEDERYVVFQSPSF